MAEDPRRSVPRTDVLLADPHLAASIEGLGLARVKTAVREAQESVRSGETAPATADALVARVLAALPAGATSLRAVINATGVMLHTNLGRAPLSNAATLAVTEAAGYVDVEYDLATGSRARRGRGALAALRRAVPAAGDVLVVNNGAAALLLAVTSLAGSGSSGGDGSSGADAGEVVMSRGELIEIGDGFRLPELITSAGAVIHEVGTTNRTTVADYRRALSKRTGCLLKVHPSNFRIEGFTAGASVAELSALGCPLVVDIGSGLLVANPALPNEPDVASTLAAGADLVLCSGDKLLGGPQSGLLFGSPALIERLRRHPMARALRVDKLTLAALEATVDGPPTPTAMFLHADPTALARRAHALVAALPAALTATVVETAGAVGGGGAPGLPLPSWAIALDEELAERLRAGTPPVVGRLEGGRCLLDLRCVAEEQDALVLKALRALSTDRAG